MPEEDRRLAELLSAAAPSAAGTRVAAIDGRSGSGKSALAAALARRTGAQVVAMEQLYGGWDGLREGIGRLAQMLAALAAGEPAAVPRYDWARARWLEPGRLAAPEILIVEGVGSGALAASEHIGLLAWIELPEALRRERAMQRDGETYEGHWERWRAQEDAYIRSDRTPQRAQIVLPLGQSA